MRVSGRAAAAARKRDQSRIGWRMPAGATAAEQAMNADSNIDSAAADVRSDPVAGGDLALYELLKHCGYAQFLGMLDGLGVLNSWGHQPEQRPLAHHSTNSFIPFSLPVAALLEGAPSLRPATNQ
jgi:hypothetical protein